ncbi:MAG: ROK family glucokinase [Lachnospiraceae bacterium]|nr:ROK family glucokinase [Lachnospiraceae bacterium]
MGKVAIGVDVGGTSVKLGLLDLDGKLLDQWEIHTRTEDSGTHILPDIAQSIQARIRDKGLEPADIIGTGIGLPGPVSEDGMVYKAVNLGWQREFNVAEELSGLLGGMKVRAGNDANVAALGEAWQGAGRGHKEMVMVTLGTGIGGGVIHDGRIVTGANGAAGEIGHICIRPDDTRKCNCGNRGCFELYGSATGIARLAEEELASSEDESVLRNGRASAKAVWDAVKEGDPLAIRVAEKFGYYLGFGLSIIAGVLNPELFVLGGGVSKAGEVIIPYIRKNLDKYVFHACNAEIVLAKLGNNAGIIGAAKLVID